MGTGTWKWKGRLRLLAGGLLAACVLVAAAACGSTSASSGGGSSASGAAGSGSSSMPWITVSVGLALSPPKMTFIAPYVAQQEGFFAKEHIKVKFVSMPNGLETELGTTAGSIIFGFSSATDSIEAAAQGAPIHAVWSYGPVLDTECIGAPSITNPAQLKGRPVGSTGTGGFSYTLVDACLRPAGLTPKQVTLVNMTRAEFVPALISHKIFAAVYHSDDAWVVTHKDPALHILVKEYQTLPQWWYGGVAVKDSWANAHPKVVERFLKAMVLADRWMYAPKNKAKVISIGVKETGEPKGAVEYAYTFLTQAHDWTLNSGISKASEAFTAKRLLNFKEINAIPPFSSVVNMTYINDVLKQVGTVNPKNYP